MKYIYALISGELILYVGENNIKLREKMHRSKEYNSSGSREIPDYIDWKVKKIESVTEDIVNIRERYYYDLLKPLYNKNKPNNKVVDLTKKVSDYIKSIELKMLRGSDLNQSQTSN